jgi:hypothetical protein
MRNLGARFTINKYRRKQQSCAYRVYETPTRCVCHSAASDSGQSPRIEAAIDAAAERPPVIARCTPDEKNGSIKASTNKNFRIRDYNLGAIIRKCTSSIPYYAEIFTGVR